MNMMDIFIQSDTRDVFQESAILTLIFVEYILLQSTQQRVVVVVQDADEHGDSKIFTVLYVWDSNNRYFDINSSGMFMMVLLNTVMVSNNTVGLRTKN